MTVIRQRLPETVFDEVFALVLGVLGQKGLLQGQTLGIAATTLAACVPSCQGRRQKLE